MHVSTWADRHLLRFPHGHAAALNATGALALRTVTHGTSG
ncbi:hypothetical protein GFS60_00058 [Rhodococcus sp. WAY2]|nr:hypothetical protein GFS60_00058 [Rhodococcus sp. WAY2]